MFSGSGNQEVPFSALKAKDSELELLSKTRMRLLMTEEEEAKQGQVQCLPGGKVIGQCVTSLGGATSKVLCKVLALSCQSRNLLRCQHTFPHTCYSGWQSHLELAICWSAQASPSLSCQSSTGSAHFLPGDPGPPQSTRAYQSLCFSFLCLL